MTKEQEDIIIRVKDLYSKYGIKSVSMDDVARDCGISKKTLYQHFKDKAELVDTVINYLIKESSTYVQSMLKQNLDAITEMYEIHSFMDKMAREHSHVVERDLQKYYPHLHEEIRNIKRDRIYTVGKANIIKGKKEGYYRKEVNDEIISKMSLLRYESSMDTCIFSDEELLSQDFFREILIYHIRGIGTEKGIEKLNSILKNNKL